MPIMISRFHKIKFGQLIRTSQVDEKVNRTKMDFRLKNANKMRIQKNDPQLEQLQN